MEDLASSRWIGDVGAVLSGYLGDANQVKSARQLIEKHANRNTLDNHFIVVRLNELDKQEELEKDLNIHFTTKIHAFALPMLRSAEDVLKYDLLISKLEKRLNIPDQTFKFFPDELPM